MIRWSVKWRLADPALPNEIERLRVVFADDPEAHLDSLARNKWRTFERRPQADDKIRELIANPDITYVNLNRIEPWQHVMAWDAAWGEPSIAMAKGRYSSAYRNRMKVTQASIRRAQSTPIPDPTPTPTTTMKFATDEEEYASGNLPSTIHHPPSPKAFTFRSYQREDIARAAMHDGAIIAWDPGLGKTMALFAFFMLKKARRVLIVAPAALHEQIIAEGLKFFGVTVRPLPDQDTAFAYMREGILPMPGQSEIENPQSTIDNPLPDYFITAYNWLGYNQGDEWQADDDETNDLIRRRRYVVAARLCGLSAPDLSALKKGESSPGKVLGLAPGAKPAAIEQAWMSSALLNDPALHAGDAEVSMRSARINDAYRKLTRTADPEHDQAFAANLQELRRTDNHRETIRRLREIEQGIGTEMRPGTKSPEGENKSDHLIRCVFKPTLCSLVKHLFDGVVCDEAVRLKSGTAYQAEGVLRMEAKYRLALTGTPIKNKLPDLFFLASFVTGSKAKATARWPYGNRTQDRAQFAQDFGVWEENMTKQEKARQDGKTSIPRGKTDPTRICNIHRLWRIIATVLIRRRKDDVPGTDIVPKTVIPVRVMPGTEQQLTYEFQLRNPPPHRSDLAELGHQLQCLRQSALYPASRSLFRPGQPRAQSAQRFTPKSAGIMQLAIDLLATGEQLVIFSPFQDFAADLADRFVRAGIPHLNLDGKTDPLKRGELVTRFKSGEFPILIAGIESMGEGHSLDTCSNLVLPSLSWAYDKNAQAIERVHRLTSKKPVTIYVMVTRNSIDERLVAMFQEKGDSNDLALDGRLVETDKEEIDLGQLLRDAVKDFDPTAATIDEREVEDQWALTLAPGLRDAYALFRELRPLPAAAPEKSRNDEPRRKPKPVMVLPDRPPLPQINNQQSTINNQQSSKPVRLFDLMKDLRRTDTPAAATEPSTINSQPSTPKDPVIPIGKIIPFPGRLGKVIPGQPAKNPVVIPACLS